ncbi:MAG: Nicotinamide-nucleotide amidohydrolase PncC [Pseudomonadota bacterium]
MAVLVSPALSIGLIIIGDEILSGKREDKHLAQVIRILNARGLSLAWSEYVGDDPQRITAVLERALASGDVVFSCGGIGATPDDHTRQCAARALGVPLALHPQARVWITERMHDMAREQGVHLDENSPENQRRLEMGMFPQGADVIANPYNKIPGFACASTHAQPGHPNAGVYFVPGFPVMAWPMIESVLDQRFADAFAKDAYREQSVIVLGAMESTLAPLMQRIEADHAGIKVFSLPSVDHPQWGKHIELGVKGAPEGVSKAYADLMRALQLMQVSFGPELVR